MKKLNNGYGLYTQRRNSHIVEAKFDGRIEIVFEGLSRKECMNWCHQNGMKMMDRIDFFMKHNASFRKTNAKNPFNPDDYKIAVIR